MQLTEEAQLNKPKLQRWLDEFGEHYSKVVVVLSVAIAVIGPSLFKWPFISTSGNVEKVLVVIGMLKIIYYFLPLVLKCVILMMLLVLLDAHFIFLKSAQCYNMS